MSLNRRGHRRFSAEPSRAAVPEILLSRAAVIVRADAKVEQAVRCEFAAASVAGG
jgi:hypothetical protein